MLPAGTMPFRDMEFLQDRAQAEMAVANDQRIMKREKPEEADEIINNTASQKRVGSSLNAPLRNLANAVIGLIGVSLDVTERKKTEDQLRLTANKLSHRVKNTLAIVQDIASQTLRGGDPTLRRKLEARLMALAAAYDVLTREKWEGANLDDVVVEALAPFGRAGGRPLSSVWAAAATCSLCGARIINGSLRADHQRFQIWRTLLPARPSGNTCAGQVLVPG